MFIKVYKCYQVLWLVYRRVGARSAEMFWDRRFCKEKCTYKGFLQGDSRAQRGNVLKSDPLVHLSEL